jgi:hypothetical protein
MSDDGKRPGAHGLMMIGIVGALLGLWMLVSAVQGMLADPGRLSCYTPPCPPQPETPWFELLLRLLAAIAALSAGIALALTAGRDPRDTTGITAGSTLLALLLAVVGTVPLLASIPPSWSAGSPQPGPLPRVISAADGGAFLALATATGIVLAGAFGSSRLAGPTASRGPGPARLAVAGGIVLWVAAAQFVTLCLPSLARGPATSEEDPQHRDEQRPDAEEPR